MKCALVGSACFLMAMSLTPRLDTGAAGGSPASARSGNVMAMLLGDSRRLFANQFFVKADAYFHSGYYPSIFDERGAYATPHIAADAGAAEEHNVGDELAFLGPTHDWIEGFGRRLMPVVHTHLDTGGAAGLAGSPESNRELQGAGIDEMLPWLQLSVAMDPQLVESYLVAAFWLERESGRAGEAEAFLREGLTANPDSYELLFELGRIALVAHQDARRAQIIWLAALRKWMKTQPLLKEPDTFYRGKILAYLATADEKLGERETALQHLEQAESVTGSKGLYRERLDRLKAGQESPALP